MKKIILLAVATGLFAVPALAQSFRIGPEIGVNVSNSTHKYELSNGRTERADYSPRAGLKAGLVADIYLDRHLYFQPGLFYNQKGYRYSARLYDYEVRVNYLEIPLNILYRAPINNRVAFFGGGGPYLAFAVGGHVDVDPGPSYDLKFGGSRNDDFSMLDAGLNFNAGLEFRPGFFLRANYGLGVANVVPNGGSDSRQHMHGFSFTAGFLF